MHARGFWCALVVAVGDVAEAAPVVPNDPLFPQQVHLTQIAAPEAWATTTGSRTVRVAIVATGIDLTHPDLVANLWTNPGEIPANGIDDDGNGYIDDVHGWDFADDTNNLQDEPGIGTHLAGIIGAAGNNGIGIAGVCHEVTLIPVRVQQSWIPAASIVDAVPAGIRYAVALGADVVLLGIPLQSAAELEALKEAETAGVLVISVPLARLARTTVDLPTTVNVEPLPTYFFALYSEALMERQFHPADLRSPGSQSWSTGIGGSYGSSFGGSVPAAAFVAGAAALVLSIDPELPAPVLRNVLVAGTEPIIEWGWMPESAGLLKIPACLAMLRRVLVGGRVPRMRGPVGGPFSNAESVLTLHNRTDGPLGWTATANRYWFAVDTGAGVLPAHTTGSLRVHLTPMAASVPPGEHEGWVTLTNTADGHRQFFPVRLSVPVPAILEFPLDTDPGWARTGTWAFGRPLGQGGTVAGQPDPTSGFTGQNVFGTNLEGDLDLTSTPQTLTAGPFNLRGRTGCRLRFRQWLNTEGGASVEISTDGVNFGFLWQAGPVQDAAWAEQDLSLAGFDNAPAVFIRWTLPFAYGSMSGWNIDDVVIAGNTAPPDADLDGLPDAWELAHGLDPASAASPHGANDDLDGDGLVHLVEYAGGTHPRQPDVQPITSGVWRDPATGATHMTLTFRRRVASGLVGSWPFPVYFDPRTGGPEQYSFIEFRAPELLTREPGSDLETVTTRFGRSFGSDVPSCWGRLRIVVQP